MGLLRQRPTRRLCCQNFKGLATLRTIWGKHMRAVFGLASLVVVLVIVAVLAKKQLGAASTSLPAVPHATGVSAPPAGNVAEQSQQLQQQVKQQVEGQMQARPISEADK